MASADTRMIAVIDDDYAVRDSFEFLLRVVGYPVQAFASAADFLKAGVENFSCLITDHYMPQVTGLELVEWLRGAETGIPVLLMVGSPSPAVASRAAKIGVDRVLERPPSERDLLEFIQQSGARPSRTDYHPGS